jgi:hypothetical protein
MRTLRRSLLLAASLWSLAAGAWALEANPECVLDVRDEYILCKATCREQYQVDKDLCRNIDHDCAEACRAGREACVADPLSELATCKDGCRTTLDAAKAQCHVDFADDPVGLDGCIDAAQLVAYSCKDGCREGVRDELKLCRRTFRACIRACPPAAE